MLVVGTWPNWGASGLQAMCKQRKISNLSLVLISSLDQLSEQSQGHQDPETPELRLRFAPARMQGSALQPYSKDPTKSTTQGLLTI